MGATTMGSRTKAGKGKQQRSDARSSVICSACGESNQGTARYCQGCGRSLAGGGWFNAQTLTVLGAACLTLLTLGLLFASVIDTGSISNESQTASAPARTAPSGEGQPPDLSTMSPREAAIRLFNRVMMADEQGNADEVAQFAPMAIAAYDRVEDLDLEAIYHIGLINAAAGDIDEAWQAVERIRSVVPEHLLASVLEHRLAIEQGNEDKAAHAIAQFKAHYEDEIKIDRQEYRDHRRQIDAFRSQLGAATRGES